jgi:signal transduction histidine kinase
VSEGAPADHFFVLLAGELRITRTYDRQSILMAVTKPGNYSGETTILLDIPWQAAIRVSKPARIFQLNQEHFWRMITTCPSIAKEIFRTATNRMRNLVGYSQQREKLVSLGTMAAGLAHELNNPAAAARRAVTHLQETMDKVQSLHCNLGKILGPDYWTNLLTAAQDATDRVVSAPVLDHLTRSDRAEVMSTWLAEHGVAAPWHLAPTFVNASLDSAWLEQLAAKLPPPSHPDAFGWLAARIDLKTLLNQVDQSTGRISELVKAIKSYSYMDQSPMQEIDIHEGIESTLTMLGYKLKNVTLVRAFDRTVPRISGYGNELNQVWTNLIDNAIDAVNGKGKICIGTCREDDQLVVEIVDNGAGIPLEVQARMFEPFFTTKGVGAGTGLGLVISNRIVGDRHGGEIEFESHPGETRFKVRLPINFKPAPPPPDPLLTTNPQN